MDENNFTVHRQDRVFEQVAKQIIHFIKSNSLKPGNKLPAERQLCQLLGVSRSSIRESIKILELLGYVTSKQGGGTFVNAPPLYIIPGNTLHFKIDHSELISYYSVFLMCSMKIVLQSLTDHSTSQETKLYVDDEESSYCMHPFFNSFINWIHTLINNNDNIRFQDLWSSTCIFLQHHQYFDNLPEVDTQELQLFLSAYHQKDSAALFLLFENLDFK
ncbi:FadR/GntR family transcriptional regulator [Sporolactobacillus kofuensis]|uniref:FadR/GntR family transcriptional regulator n=1 Tax=Sporolactobacillus kofuensis TaxID=269672 RepID=A0ABW1WBE3_9BACL|nr:GntR family transcriptional regulator [Sporolactobacillus kofuensis]